MSIDFKEIKNHLMISMSYMILITAIGGIFYAGSIAFGGTAVVGEGMVTKNESLLHVQEIGRAGLFLTTPVLAGYIAHVIADRPALVPGLVTDYITNTETTAGENTVKTGLPGTLVLDFMTGYLIKYMKKIHYPGLIKSVVPILTILVVTSFIVCIFYMYILANPIGMAMGGVESFLTSLSSGSKIVLSIIMGMTVTVDMGGPVNETAYLFSIGMTAEGHYELFGICAVPVCTAPLGMGPVVLLAKNKYTREERDADKTPLLVGLIGISEGTVPLAVADPAEVIPSIMTGGAVGGAIVVVASVKDYTPHGGPIVLPIIDEKIWLVIAIIAGTLVTAILVSLLKEPVAQTELVDK